MKRLAHFVFVRHRHNWKLFFKFALVGGSGVLVNMLVAVTLNKLNGGTAYADAAVWPLVGDYAVRFSTIVWVVAFLVANLYNFQLNRWWTFKSAKHASWWSEFWPFFVVGAVAAAIGALVKWAMKNPGSPFFLPEPFFHETGPGIHSREYWAHLIAIVLTVPINFVVNKMWTFAAVRGHHVGEPGPTMMSPVVAPEIVADSEEHLGEIVAVPDADGRIDAGGRVGDDTPPADVHRRR